MKRDVFLYLPSPVTILWCPITLGLSFMMGTVPFYTNRSGLSLFFIFTYPQYILFMISAARHIQVYIIRHTLVTSSTVPCTFVAQFNGLFLMLHVLKHHAISKQNNGGRLQAAFIIWPTQLGSLLWKLSFALPV